MTTAQRFAVRFAAFYLALSVFSVTFAQAQRRLAERPQPANVLITVAASGERGILTKDPQAALDVEGTIRPSKGIAFPDGSVLTSAGASKDTTSDAATPEAVTVTGTTGRLVKWTDGPAGALGDSVVHETAAKIGIGTIAPAANLDVVGTINTSMHYQIGGQRVLGAVGSGNLFAGLGAGTGITTGVNNSFFGISAGQANRTGSTNAFFGTSAGALNTSGFNAFFGAFAGDHTNTGNSNSFFGALAGRNNQTGLGNSFFGRNAGFNNTASYNSFFGYLAGSANTSGTSNAFFGSNAGGANQTGIDNAFFGYRAGALNTANYNSFFGSGAGDANTSGYNNSFFGTNAGGANQTGFHNSFFGAYAGEANQTGFANAFFGAQAGRQNTATGNSFFGASAGRSNTSGSANSFFGHDAGGDNQVGSNNSFFGSVAGLSTTGSDNAFFGSNAGGNTTSGTGNSFFGKSTGIENQTGANNTFIGLRAGRQNRTGSNNIAIGARADFESTDLSFATAIGAETVVTTSNTIQLGRNTGSDAVRIPGRLRLITLGAAGSTALCRNASSELATCSSSLRYKTDVRPFMGGLSLLNRLHPVSFAWKADGMPDIGLGAEEVAEVEPRLVTRNSQGQIEGIKYDRLNAVLINAVKEQQAQLKQQQQLIELLRSRLAQVERAVKQRRNVSRSK